MNKYLLTLAIAVLLILVGLSGCNEQTATEVPEDNTITIENQKPTASCSANPKDGTAPLTVYFVGSGSDSDGTIESYHWDFDAGESSTQQNPSHTFQSSGTYTVTLTVTDDYGDTAVDTLYINVLKPYIPEPEIIDHNSYRSGSDWVYIVGLVKNVASVCINDVEIKATLYDSAGNVIKTSIEYNPYAGEYYYDEANPSIVEPGDTACFKISFDDVSYYDHYGVEIFSFETDFNEGYGDELVIENVEGGLETYSFGSEYYNIRGNVKNTGSNVYSNVFIYAIFYDSTGKIIDVDYGGAGDSFPYTMYAGQEESFFIQIADWEFDTSLISDYELKIEYL